jgi:hypothetical protein
MVVGGCAKKKNWKSIQPFLTTFNLEHNKLGKSIQTQIFQMLDYSIYRAEFVSRERFKNRVYPLLIVSDFSQDLVVFEWHNLSDQWEIQHHLKNLHSNRISQIMLFDQVLITSSADHTISYVFFSEINSKEVKNSVSA